MAENLLSRKFIFAILVSVLSFVMVLVEKLSPSDWLEFEAVIGAVYVIGNSVEKIVDATKK